MKNQNSLKSTVEYPKDQYWDPFSSYFTLMILLTVLNICLLHFLLMILMFFYKSKSLNELSETVNNELTNLSLWFRTNKLSLNI